MNDDPHNNDRLIGLHKLAEQDGDGLLPELYAIMRDRAEANNVVAFPADAGVDAPRLPSAETGRVLAFRR